MDTNPGLQKKSSFSCLEIAIVAFVILILAAIAIPDFVKINNKAPQSEAKTNLGAIFTTQVAYFGEKNTYAGGPGAFSVMGWEPEGENKYAYFCDGDFIPNKKGDPIPRGLPQLPDGVRPATTETSFTCMAVGNVDNDADLDVWTIDDAKQLTNVRNDI